MSETGWNWLPEPLRAREHEPVGSGQLRLVESTLLVLVAILLAVATVYDVGRQVKVNDRLNADLRTWRAYTGHAYHNLAIDQELLGSASKREVVCGNTAPGPPKAKTQICLEIWGSLAGGKRVVHGGWYLTPRSEDERGTRYGCFGDAVAEGICPR